MTSIAGEKYESVTAVACDEVLSSSRAIRRMNQTHEPSSKCRSTNCRKPADAIETQRELRTKSYDLLRRKRKKCPNSRYLALCSWHCVF